MENLKFIIDEINQLFNGDYNCSSFSDLSPEQLLQIVGDVMQQLEICDQINVEQNKEKAAYEILNTLEAIKYIPDYKIFPADFRNGLIASDTKILYPILSFLLTNKNNVKCRHYLSKYVNKIDIPEDVLEDDKIAQLYDCYTKTVDEFWKAYTENKNLKEHAKEFAELEGDISQMKLEMANLTKRLQAQKDKLSAEGDSVERFQYVKELCAENKKNQKLTKQLQDERSKVESLCDEIKRCTRRDKIDNLEDFLERSENHKHTESMYDHVLKEIESELMVFKEVAEGIEPKATEIEDLEIAIHLLQDDIINLNDEKATNYDENVEVYLNQIKVIEKKKAILSKQIMKLRLKNDEVLSKIEEICSLLGGDVLHGKNLKEYVARLRHMSTIYKELKQYMNSLQTEYGVLGRTLEILHIQNPDLAEKLQEHKKVNKQIQEECDAAVNTREIQAKYQTLYKDCDVARKDFLIDKIKYDKVKTVFDDLYATHSAQKAAFEEHAGDLQEDVESICKGFKSTQDLIDMEMEDLNKYVSEAEEYKECMLRYSEDIIENAGGTPFLNQLKDKLHIVEEKRDELRKQFEAKKQAVNKEIEEMNMFNGMKEMVLLKIKESSIF